MKKKIDWINYQILELPKAIAFWLAKQSLFIKTAAYSGRGDTFAQQCEWVMKRLKRGEIGIFLGYRIICKEKK